MSDKTDYADDKRFAHLEKVWALVDGYKLAGIYEEPSGDGFHYVRVYSNGPDLSYKTYRLSNSEIDERVI